jgi:hypothetical protein
VVSNRKKSAGAVSTGQEEKYNWDSIRTGNHSAFSKADQCSFSMTFAVSKSNQNIRIFSAVPAIN